MGGASGGRSGAGGSDTASGGLNGSGGQLGSGGFLGTGGIVNTWEPILLHTYESGELPGDSSTSDNANLYVQAGTAHQGLHSLVANIPEESNGSATMTFDLSEDSLNKVYLRAWLYVPHDTLTGSVTLFSFESENDSLEYGIGSDGTTYVGLASSDASEPSAEGYFVAGEWFCFRAEAIINDVDGSVTVRVDDQISQTTPSGDTRPGDGILSFTYGIIETSFDQGATTVYFDDVAVDDQPIGCDMNLPVVVEPPETEPNP